MSVIENKTFDEITVGQSAQLDRVLTEDDVVLFENGLWGSSLISAILSNELVGPGAIYKSQNLKFLTKIALGDTITVLITVTTKNDKEKSVSFDCRATNQTGTKIFIGTTVIVAPLTKQQYEHVALPEVHMGRGHHVFETLIGRCSSHEPIVMAVCHPCDEVSLRGATEAAERGLILPLLVGPSKRIRAVAHEFSIDIKPYRIIDTKHSHDSALQAVALCRSGEAAALMKGSLHTDEIMHEVAQRETGLRTGRRFSHVFIMDVPNYSKMLLITDAAINIYPTLEEKADILQNAIDLAHMLGVPEPKVAILSAVETIYPKITSTIEAAALCKMADRGQIHGAILDGPLAFDNAISEEAARIKKIISPVAGRADILMVPDLESGNMLAKQLAYLADADMAGIVVGARVPIVLTSRADSARARLASCAVAALYAKHSIADLKYPVS